MCGVVGIAARKPVNQDIYDALTVLQHRGQDAAGIMTTDQKRVYLRKDNGLVREVFQTRHMHRLPGNMGIGHLRYPTAGSSSSAEAQPFFVNSPYGISLAHNGNLTNSKKIAEELYKSDLRHLNTSSDSETLLNIFAHELQALGKLKPKAEDIFTAVSRVHKRSKGGYAVIAMITGHGMVAFRDPNGIRPLVYGKRQTREGTEYMIASETVALDSLEFELVDDVAPGETIFIDCEGNLASSQCADSPKLNPCIFEHIYLARPDSLIDGISVYKARLRMGDKLANKIKRTYPDFQVDSVIPIPDTSRTSAIQLAWHLGAKYREGFIKNRYIGRTFIMPGQTMRKKSVRQKLNPIDLEFKGKNVLLVDDSIVRGTTSQEIVQMARNAGAKKVFFASAAPPVRWPNVYGIDMPTRKELIASVGSEQDVAKKIGADWLVYQDLADLIESCSGGSKKIDTFECSVFDGEYLTGDVTEAYLQELEAFREQSYQNDEDPQQGTDTMVVDLHNN
ncbi:MAG: amidophosphoribosyltransferase [Zetaproteobacteria bacterium]|nr:amidophosphoribosyltransferase [Pseudobdellovibrionaceae bacterium]